MQLVFDAEFNGLNPTKIHCLSNSSGNPTLSSYNQIKDFLLKQDTLIGHNIIRYDIPHLERILDIKIKARLIDTLALSWYLDPDRLKHGLGDWGEEFGVPKPKVDDWDNLTLEEYSYRCEEDVRINTILWDRQYKQLINLYGSEGKANKLIDYLMFKMKCARDQEKYGWKLDVDRCLKGKVELEEEYQNRYELLKGSMPLVPVIGKRKPPKKSYKMNGELSASGIKWMDLLERTGLPKDYEGVVEEVIGYSEPNPNSHKQVKEWLFSLGWSPINFKYVRDNTTGEFKKIPQIKSDDGDGLCPSVLSLNNEAIPNLDGMYIISNRISTLKGFLENVDDKGFIQAKIQGFTNTLRFKHKGVVNLPSTERPYGKLIRGCLVCPEGYELAGSDMSSLEDRTKQHYMWDYDPDYVSEMIQPDFDPHLDIGVVSGMISPEDSVRYKQGDQEAKSRLNSIRHDAKQVNYSCTYGVTPQGLVRNTGWRLNKAREMHKMYWKRNWAITKIADSCVIKQCNNYTWLYNPVSELWYSLRHKKDKFSTLNQGTGTYCFDTWIKYVRKGGPPCIGQFHDEGIWVLRKGNRDRLEKHLRNSINKANGELNLNRGLDISLDFGDSYAEIH